MKVAGKATFELDVHRQSVYSFRNDHSEKRCPFDIDVFLTKIPEKFHHAQHLVYVYCIFYQFHNTALSGLHHSMKLSSFFHSPFCFISYTTHSL